jgi:hypothetical protein
MLIKLHLAAVWSLGCTYSYSRFHEGILVVACGRSSSDLIFSGNTLHAVVWITRKNWSVVSIPPRLAAAAERLADCPVRKECSSRREEDLLQK